MSAAKDSPFKVVYLHQENKGANAARNHAVEKASGRLLLFINDDTIATPEMIKEHIKTHEEYPDENVSVLGKVTISPQIPYSPFARLHLDAAYARWTGKIELDWRAFYTCNVSVKKSLLMPVGGTSPAMLFEERIRYHEDLELSQRLDKYGFKVLYNPAALGYHDHFLTEQEYLNTAAKEGKAIAIWYKIAPHLRGELALLGFPSTSSLPKKTYYAAADMVVNRITRPLILQAARLLLNKNEDAALKLYAKLFQSLKREEIRREMKKGL
jgi:GT2 family glycosyltransferase